MIARILTIVILLTLFMQDRKDRQVHWFLFPLLVALFLFQKAAPYRNLTEVFLESLYTFCFLLTQLIILTVYFSIKNKRPVLITDHLIGLGDILLLFSLCFYFNLFTYVLFYVGSLVAVLGIWVIWQAFVRQKTAHIPFAGLQALLLSIVLLFSWMGKFDLGDDRWLILMIS